MAVPDDSDCLNAAREPRLPGSQVRRRPAHGGSARGHGISAVVRRLMRCVVGQRPTEAWWRSPGAGTFPGTFAGTCRGTETVDRRHSRSTCRSICYSICYSTCYSICHTVGSSVPSRRVDDSECADSRRRSTANL
jgi:hypothetical protein